MMNDAAEASRSDADAPGREDRGYTLDEMMLIQTTSSDAPQVSEALIQRLNRLYALESGAAIRSLATWMPYTSVRTLGLRSVARKHLEASRRQVGTLGALIRDLGRTPQPTTLRTNEPNANDNDWSVMLPLLIESKRRMLARYEELLGDLDDLAGGDRARPVISGLRDENARQLDELTSWLTRLGIDPRD